MHTLLICSAISLPIADILCFASSILHALHVVIGTWLRFYAEADSQMLQLHDSSNCLQVGDFWYKRFPKSGSRMYQPSLELFPNAKKVLDVQDLVILQFPSIKGSHWPSQVDQVIAFVQSVSAIHLNGCVHADIRLSNVIFTLVCLFCLIHLLNQARMN